MREGYGEGLKMAVSLWPSDKARMHAQRPPQASQVIRPRNFHRSESRGVVGQELDIEQLKVALAQAVHQVSQGDLGSITHAREHRLAREEAADGHAVDAAG